MKHEREGAGVVEWWVVMTLVGRPFLKNHKEGFEIFGPLGTDGEVLSERMHVFGVVVESIGKAFFATGNEDVNALRTAQEVAGRRVLAEY